MLVICASSFLACVGVCFPPETFENYLRLSKMAITCILRQIPCLSATVKRGIERVFLRRNQADQSRNKTSHSLQFSYSALPSILYPYLGLYIQDAPKFFITLPKKVARIITHSPPLSHSKPLFLELHILNIHLIYNYQLACFVFQHINHLLPLPASSLFQFNYHIHNYSTRHKHDLHILPHKQSFSIRTQGPKCWNALPLSLRQSLRIHNYKKILKKYYLSLINTSDL